VEAKKTSPAGYLSDYLLLLAQQISSSTTHICWANKSDYLFFPSFSLFPMRSFVRAQAHRAPQGSHCRSSPRSHLWIRSPLAGCSFPKPPWPLPRRDGALRLPPWRSSTASSAGEAPQRRRRPCLWRSGALRCGLLVRAGLPPADGAPSVACRSDLAELPRRPSLAARSSLDGVSRRGEPLYGRSRRGCGSRLRIPARARAPLLRPWLLR
jgi:hypothetical protein